MCGLTACLLYPQERSPATWRAIGQVFTRSLLHNETRGRAATGIAVMEQDGPVTVYKQPQPAADFVVSPPYRNLLAGLNADTVLLLGHTRRPTKGTPAHNGNNHPLQVGPIYGIHNGHIDNDDALFMAERFPRQAQVDSEIIFHLLGVGPASPVEVDNLAAAGQRLAQLAGQVTFLACDRRAPGRLLAMRHKNPLSLHYHAPWQALLFSSSYLFLRKTFGRILLTETMPHDQLMLFDARTLPRQAHRPLLSHPFAGTDTLKYFKSPHSLDEG